MKLNYFLIICIVSIIFTACGNRNYKLSEQIESSNDTTYLYNNVERKIGMIVMDKENVLEITVYPKGSQNFKRFNFNDSKLTRYGEYLDSTVFKGIDLIRYQDYGFYADSGLDTVSVVFSQYTHPPNGQEMIYETNGSLRQTGFWKYDSVKYKSMKNGVWSFYSRDKLFRQVKYSNDTIKWYKDYSLK